MTSVSAAGLAGVPFDPDSATLTLQGTTVFRNGQPVPFDAERVSAALQASEVRAELTCRRISISARSPSLVSSSSPSDS